MKRTVKTFALSAMSVALLSGCVFEQRYEPPVKEPEPNKNLQLYGNDSDSRFALTVIDSNGNLGEVSDTGDIDSLNIKTQAIGGWESGAEGTVFVSITGNQPASIMTTSAEPQDISQYTDNATVQFSLLPISQPQQDKAVTLSMAGAGSAVNITSVVNAFVGSKTGQRVKVPLSCFKNVDVHNINTPFSLNSESNLHFELGDIAITSNSLDEAQVLACSPEGVLLDDAQSTVFAIEDGQLTGWANEIITDKDVEASVTDTGVRVTYFGKQVLNGGVTLSTVPEIVPATSVDNAKDLSLYMENGELEFDITVNSFGQHPTGEFEVTVSSDQDDEIAVYTFLLPMPEQNTTQTITVPVKELLTQADGTVAVNTVLNMKQPLTIRPAAVSAGNTLMGMDFTVGNVQLLMNTL